MHPFWKKLEHYNSRLIPYALGLLLLIIVVEVGEQFSWWHIENLTLSTTIHALDYLIIAIFVIDLIFLAIRARKMKTFFKHYWLDILAVFPLALAFSLLSRVYELVIATEQVVIGQSVVHEAVEAEKLLAKEERLAKEARAVARSGRIARVVRITARSLRLLLKSRFLTKVGRHRRKRIL